MMKHFLSVLLFLSSVNVFPQPIKDEIIKNKFVELINLYDENKQIIEYEQFEIIIKSLKYIFINNNEKIIISIEKGLLGLNFYENEIQLDIVPRFAPMHLTGSFTYCTGTLSINNLSFNFYLYERNKYSWEYDDVKDNNKLAFCYFDINDENYAYFNLFRPYDYDFFTINKYRNLEYFLELPYSKIKTVIFYNGNN